MLNSRLTTAPPTYWPPEGEQAPKTPVNPWTDPVLLLKLTSLPFPLTITRLTDKAQIPTVLVSEGKYFSIAQVHCAHTTRIDSKKGKAMKTDIAIDFPPGVRGIVETFHGSKLASARLLRVERMELPTMDTGNLIITMFNTGPTSHMVARGDIIAEIRFFFCLNVKFRCAEVITVKDN